MQAMDLEKLIPIIVGALVAGLISAMLFVARKINKNELFEIQAKRVNLLDTSSVRLQLSFLNTLKQREIIRDLTLVYRDGNKMIHFVTPNADPFIDRGDKKSVMELNPNGQNSLRIEGNAACSCYYSFQKNESVNVSVKAKLYISYKNERNKRFYAEFDPTSPHAQLLQFRKRNWEK